MQERRSTSCICERLQHDFNNCVQFNAFASKAATNSDRGHSSDDFRIFNDRALTATFSDFRKLINAFHFFLATMGEGATQVD